MHVVIFNKYWIFVAGLCTKWPKKSQRKRIKGLSKVTVTVILYNKVAFQLEWILIKLKSVQFTEKQNIVYILRVYKLLVYLFLFVFLVQQSWMSRPSLKSLVSASHLMKTFTKLLKRKKKKRAGEPSITRSIILAFHYFWKFYILRQFYPDGKIIYL